MRQKKRKLAKPLKRKIHFPNDEVWSYAISNHGVRIRSPEGKTTRLSMVQFMGCTPENVGEALWKNSVKQIKPSHIKNYIEKHLRK